MTGKVTGNSAAEGGGVYVFANEAGETWASHVDLTDAMLCNNLASYAGADLYDGGLNVTTIQTVGEGWSLDACRNHTIDNWYTDAAGARWSHTSAQVYAMGEDGTPTITEPTALRAAHKLMVLKPDDPMEWEISKSKTATDLDANYESQVTLSLPAASYKGDLDVVFVLDGSFSAEQKDLAGAASDLLDTLSGYENLNVKIGLVIFGGEVPVLYNSGELLSLSDTDNVTALKKEITDETYKEKPGRSGSNLQAGVEAGQALLDGDANVDAADKYLILLTDGAARMWYEDGQAMSQAYYPYNDSTGSGFWWNSSSDWYELRYASKQPDFDFSDIWTLGQSGTVIGAYGLSYADKESGNYTTEDIAPYEVMMNGDYHTTYEAATYYAATSIVDAAQKNQVIFVSYPYYDDTTHGQYIESFKAWLDGNGIVTRYDSKNLLPEEVFSGVQDELLQLVAAGSSVIDVIGYGTDDQGNAYDFDFVDSLDALHLTVGGVELSKEALVDPQYSMPGVTSAYGFGGDADGYDFVLYYYADGQDGASDECFVWQINVAVTKDAPVQLTYTVQLTNPQTVAGTYGGLYTNDSAILYPVDTDGKDGTPEEFEKPTVDYTVSGGTTPENPGTGTDPAPGGGDGDSTTIPDENTPTTELPDEEPPTTEQPEEEPTELPEEETPLAEVPETGDWSALWLAMTALSGTGLAGVTFLGRKKRDEE